MVGGELHAPGAVLVLGDPGTGTTTLGLELLQHELNSGKYCGLITYDAFPSELLKKFENLGIDVSKHVDNGSLKMIDCYSALIGDEKAPIKDAVDFTEISIQVTRIIEAAKGPITLLLDSVNPIFNSTQPNTVINFLRVLGAKIKNNGGLFVMTGTRRSMAEEVTSKVEVVVDTVIELNMAQKGNNIVRTLSFRKMAGHHYSMAPAEFKIVSGKGMLFKKHRITLPKIRNMNMPNPNPTLTKSSDLLPSSEKTTTTGSSSSDDSEMHSSEWP
jgi:KaiC/GvpD/RAD55 family RecA-like ATPase